MKGYLYIDRMLTIDWNARKKSMSPNFLENYFWLQFVIDFVQMNWDKVNELEKKS